MDIKPSVILNTVDTQFTDDAKSSPINRTMLSGRNHRKSGILLEYCRFASI
jgi:hypothetical protein